MGSHGTAMTALVVAFKVAQWEQTQRACRRKHYTKSTSGRFKSKHFLLHQVQELNNMESQLQSENDPFFSCDFFHESSFLEYHL